MPKSKFHNLSSAEMLTLIMNDASSDPESLIYDKPLMISLSTAIKTRVSQYQTSKIPPEEIMAGIYAIKRWNIEQRDVVDHLIAGTMIQYAFDHYIEHTDVANLIAPGGITVDLGGGTLVTHGCTTDHSKYMQMESFYDKDFKLSDWDSQRAAIRGLLKCAFPHDDSNFVTLARWQQAFSAFVLKERYHKDDDTVIALLQEDKAIEICFIEFLRETTTEVISGSIGEPPSQAIN